MSRSELIQHYEAMRLIEQLLREDAKRYRLGPYVDSLCNAYSEILTQLKRQEHDERVR